MRTLVQWPGSLTMPPIASHDLDAVKNPNDLSYKVPGLLTWAILGLSVIGAWFFPRPVLIIATAVSLYMVLRFLIILVFYIIGVLRCRRWAAQPMPGWSAAPVTDGVRPEEIHHVVLVANYREPIEVLARTLRGLAAQEDACHRLTVVLAMEAEEEEAHEKVQALQAQFTGQFGGFFATYHPTGLPGEIRGKGSNLRWAAHEAERRLVDQEQMPLDHLTLTSADSDSLFHPRYFATLTRLFASDRERHLRFWQAPLLLDNNIWKAPTLIRLFTFMTNVVHLAEQSNAVGFPLPLSTFTLSYKLGKEVGYWDPAVIADDTHMFLRCYFATRGRVKMTPVYLPTRGDAITGPNLRQTLISFYRQKLRHAWGCQDASYVLQQWGHVPGMSFGKKLAPMIKVLHDHLIFSIGGGMALLGTVLALTLDSNPVVTLPAGFAYPLLLQAINAVGAVGLWGTWITERIRMSSDVRHWRLSTLISEILGWALIPAASFVMLGVPVLHAQTKMLFGSQLTFARTPKQIDAEPAT